jgi:hypothetical protein
MNPMLKLAAPAVLGALAGFLNWTIVRSQMAPHAFVVVRQQVKVGEKIEAVALARLEVPGDPERSRKTLIPYEDRDVIIGTRSQRELHPNDLVLWQDVQRPNAEIVAEPDELILPIDLSGVTVETGLLFPGHLVEFWIAPPKPDGSPPAREATAAGSAPLDYQLIGPFRILSVGMDSDQFAAQQSAERRERSRGNDRVISVAVKLQADGHYDAQSRRLLEAHAQKRVMAIVLRPTVQRPG